MILSTLSNYVNRRHDLSKTVSTFFVSHFKKIIDLKSHLVILRIMRAISYYPSAIYFLFIETQLTMGRVFILEGIKSFERILKCNNYPELLNLLSSIFMNLMEVMKVGDPLMQLIVMDYYETMLRRTPMLYFRCREKIKEEFYLNKEIN